MENSFSEYRNDNGTKSGSESDEIIDNSFMSNSFGLKNKLLLSAKKNRTVYIAPSDSDDSENDSEVIKSDSPERVSHPSRNSSAVNSYVVESSGEEEESEKSKQGSLRRSLNLSTKVVLSSSSDDEEISPEIIPRRRPTRKSSDHRSSDSPLIRKVVRKRIVLTDSENDNSIILENDNHKKITCLKDTPLKLEEGFKKNVKAVKMVDDDDGDQSETGSGDGRAADQEGGTDLVTSDEGPDEDEMVMSRATRMSIMGLVPKDLTSDESDFIQSDDSKSRDSFKGSTNSINKTPITQSPLTNPHPNTPPKSPAIEIDDQDSSRLSCSTFGSPVHNTSVDVDLTVDIEPKSLKNRVQNDPPKNKVLNNIIDSSSENIVGKKYMIVYDDDVTMIVNNEPEVIALSSDDDEEKSPKVSKEKSPRTTTGRPKKSPSKTPSDKSKVPSSESFEPSGQGTMNQYLKPTSYPNQGVVFVKRSVKEKEFSKLNQLKEDVFNVRIANVDNIMEENTYKNFYYAESDDENSNSYYPLKSVNDEIDEFFNLDELKMKSKSNLH